MREIHTFEPEYDDIDHTSFSPDGQRVLCYRRRWVDGNEHHSLRLWLFSNRQVLGCLGQHDDTISAVVWSPDSRYILTAQYSGNIHLWDAELGHEFVQSHDVRKWAGQHGAVHALAFLPDGKRFIAANRDGTACVWDVWATDQSKSVLGCFTGHREVRHSLSDGESVESVTVSADGKSAVTADLEGNLLLWDVNTCKKIKRIAQVTADGGVAASNIDIYNGKTGEITTVPALKGVAGVRIRKVAFFPDGQRIAVCTDDISEDVPAVIVFDVATGKQLMQHHETGKAPGPCITSLAVSPDGRWLVYSPWAGPIRVIDANTGRVVRSFEGHVRTGTGRNDVDGTPGGVNNVSISPDGKYVVSGGEDGTCRLWEMPGSSGLGAE